MRKNDNEAATRYPCAFAGCSWETIAHVRLATGWAYLCHPHYARHWQEEADRWCRARGVTDRASAIAWIRGKMQQLGKRPAGRSWAWELKARHDRGEALLPVQYEAMDAALRGRFERIPGEDDEPI